jgi:hypothetical protein
MPAFKLACDQLMALETELAEAEGKLGDISARRIEHREAPFKLSEAKGALREKRAHDIIAGTIGAVHPAEQAALEKASAFADAAADLDRAHEIVTAKVTQIKAALSGHQGKLNGAMAIKLADVSGPVRARVKANLQALAEDVAMLAALDKACGASEISTKGLPQFLLSGLDAKTVDAKAARLHAKAISNDFIGVMVWQKQIEVTAPGRSKTVLNFNSAAPAQLNARYCENPAALLGADLESLGGDLRNLSDAQLTAFAERSLGGLGDSLLEIRRI